MPKYPLPSNGLQTFILENDLYKKAEASKRKIYFIFYKTKTLVKKIEVRRRRR
jgi:hypothetical protein